MNLAVEAAKRLQDANGGKLGAIGEDEAEADEQNKAAVAEIKAAGAGAGAEEWPDADDEGTIDDDDGGFRDMLDDEDDGDANDFYDEQAW